VLDEHKKAFPDAPFALGYPDMGSGRFSQRLSYAQWFAFNTAQRGHQNFLESAWGVMSLLLVGGLFNPRVYAALGGVYLVARFLYAVGYAGNRGPKGREAGAIGGALAMLGMMFYTMYTGVALVKAGAGGE
jgi:glutathione S-transferase